MTQSYCETCSADSYGAPLCSTCEARAEVERLREALRRVMGLDGRDETFCLDQKCGTCDECFARAALAGAPSETRTEPTERIARRIESLLSTPCATPDFLEGVRRAAQRVRVGHLTTVVDAVSEPVETRRAEVERLREALTATCLERDALKAEVERLTNLLQTRFCAPRRS